MKSVAISLLLTLVAMPAWAAFDVGVTETFDDGLGAWLTNGQVSLVTDAGTGNNYVRLADFGYDLDNWISHSFYADQTGDYALSFDYRFRGVDTLGGYNDTVNVGIIFVDEYLYTYSSETDLNNSDDWTEVIAPPPSVMLNGGRDYWVFFRLNEAATALGGSLEDLELITVLDVDNINLQYLDGSQPNVGQPSIVPTPGGLILGTIGVGLVGFLRRRNSL